MQAGTSVAQSRRPGWRHCCHLARRLALLTQAGVVGDVHGPSRLGGCGADHDGRALARLAVLLLAACRHGAGPSRHLQRSALARGRRDGQRWRRVKLALPVGDGAERVEDDPEAGAHQRLQALEARCVAQLIQLAQETLGRIAQACSGAWAARCGLRGGLLHGHHGPPAPCCCCCCWPRWSCCVSLLV